MKFILICIILMVILIIWRKLFKLPPTNNLVMVTGPVKCGKSGLTCYWCIKDFKKAVRKVRFINFFRKMFKKPLLEEPLLYSNIPLKVDYVPLTEEILLREERQRYGSYTFVDEASLLSNSMNFKDEEKNEQQLLFNKLYGHATRGGKIYYNTQSMGDVHFAVKRSACTFYWIHHKIKLPFITILYLQECVYSENGEQVNTYSEDVESNLKRVIMWNKYYKYYDCFCYENFTRNLPVNEKVVKGSKDLQAKKIISFNKYKGLYKGVKKKDEKENNFIRTK